MDALTTPGRGSASMPYEYSVADGDGLIHVTAWGDADLAEIVALLRQMEADTRVRPEMPALVDARNQQFRLPPLSLRQLADLHVQSRAGARRPVAVVCAAGLDYGLGRMLSVFSEMRGAVLQVFTDHGEAVAWARTQLPRDSHGQKA
jgi:hypothetical protein